MLAITTPLHPAHRLFKSSIARDAPIDLTDPHPDSDDDFSIFPPTEEMVSKERLHEIFSQLLRIVNLCCGDTSLALKILLGGPNVPDFCSENGETAVVFALRRLQLLRKNSWYTRHRCYKHPSFNPLVAVRVSFVGQSVTDVLCHLAKGELQRFHVLPNHLRVAYGPQVLPVMKILGTLIAHSYLHEGPGFPYCAPFCLLLSGYGM